MYSTNEMISLSKVIDPVTFMLEEFIRGAFNNVAASLAASLDRSSSIERISRKAKLAKMASVTKVF